MPTSRLHGLLYRSTASPALTSRDLLALLSQSMRANVVRGLTGRLFIEDVDGTPGTLVQWIEGPTEAVSSLYRKIERDPRHSDVEVLASGPLVRLTGRAGRLYPDWSMSLETEQALPTSLSEFLALYEDHPERCLVQRWGVAA